MKGLIASVLGVVAAGLVAWAAPTQVGGEKGPVLLHPGDKAPDFKLKDTEGKEHQLAKYLADGNIVVLEWFNPDCPFSRKHHVANQTMTETFRKYKGKKVIWLAINSGAPGKQGAGLDRNIKARKDYKIEYPVLLDETGKVGRAYQAKRTPHMFVIAPDQTLLYMGAIDNSPSPRKLGDVNYVDDALAQYLAGKTIKHAETKAYGCSIKYAN